MPLPEPAAREPAHTRSITYQGFRREDGLWDIEAHMTDVKSYSFQNHFRGTIEAGEALHEMLLRVTIDDEFVIQDVIAVTDNSPFENCPEIVGAYKSLAGIKMGPGWRRNIRQKVGGVNGCTHLTELMFPMATVAMQTLWAFKNHRRHKTDQDHTRERTRPGILDTCHAWAATSPVVKRNAPEYYTGP